MATAKTIPQSDLADTPRGMDLLNRQGLNKGTAEELRQRVLKTQWAPAYASIYKSQENGQ